jgi:penicillin-binding protein 2
MKARTTQAIGLITWGIIAAFMLLFARLYYLQIMRGQFYLQRSESNFVQERAIKHSRGKILDSDGNILVDNRLAYDVYVTYAMLPESLRYVRSLTQSLKLSRKETAIIDAELNLWNQFGIDERIVLAPALPKEECDRLMDVTRVQMITGVSLRPGFYENQPVCELAIDPMTFPTRRQTVGMLKNLLGTAAIDLEGSWARLQKKAVGLAKFQPALLMSDIGYDAYARMENAISLGQLSGLTVVSSKRRRYVFDDLATHAIGFLNQVSLEDLRGNDGYRGGDFIGRRGIEASFESHLRGQDGIERVVVDAKGRRFSESWESGLLGMDRRVEPVAGHTVKMSLNYPLQKAAQEYFKGISGSVIVMDVNTGFILAVASFPAFNPNLIVGADNASFLRQLLLDEARPFRNKVLQDHYSPGSTFKPFTGLAGLNKHFITPSYEHYCSGNYRIHKTHWRCYERKGHGPINLTNALKVSCDSYFYELGHRMGLETLAQSAAKVGFGRKTGIDLAGETAGILPNREYYQKRLGYVAPGFVVNMAIGQGDLAVTPLQLVTAYAALANGGTVYRPQLVREILDEEGHVLNRYEKEVTSSVAEESASFKEILSGMSNVVSPSGSAASVRYRPENKDIFDWIKANGFNIVGKTGTAQVVKLSKAIDHLRPEDVEYKHRDHSWFAGVFPEVNPEIAVVVMTEHGGFGTSSTPTALRLMKKWHELTAMNKAPATGGSSD